jgi:hypothetical protein
MVQSVPLEQNFLAQQLALKCLTWHCLVVKVINDIVSRSPGYPDTIVIRHFCDVMYTLEYDFKSVLL